MSYSIKKQKGQTTILFILLFAVFIVAMSIVVDGGRFLILHNQTKIYADSMALAAGGAWNTKVFQTSGSYPVVIDETFATARAKAVFNEGTSREEQSWMQFTWSIDVSSGDTVTVIVNGTAPTLFLGAFGRNSFSTSATSTVKFTVGIDTPVN